MGCARSRAFGWRQAHPTPTLPSLRCAGRGGRRKLLSDKRLYNQGQIISCRDCVITEAHNPIPLRIQPFGPLGIFRDVQVVRWAIDLDDDPSAMRCEISDVARLERHLPAKMQNVERWTEQDAPDRAFACGGCAAHDARPLLQLTVAHPLPHPRPSRSSAAPGGTGEVSVRNPKSCFLPAPSPPAKRRAGRDVGALQRDRHMA